MSDAIVKKPTPLPVTTSDLLAARKVMHQRTLNDYVEDCHVALWSNDRYRALLDAVYDEDAVEGSLSADNVIAAGMIRDYANEKGMEHIRKRKLATIVKSLNVVLRRYEIDRTRRKNTIGGEIVPGGPSDNRNGNNGE